MHSNLPDISQQLGFFPYINSHTVHLLGATGHCWYIIPKTIISLMVLHRILKVDQNWTAWTWS